MKNEEKLAEIKKTIDAKLGHCPICKQGEPEVLYTGFTEVDVFVESLKVCANCYQKLSSENFTLWQKTVEAQKRRIFELSATLANFTNDVLKGFLPTIRTAVKESVVETLNLLMNMQGGRRVEN